jgi:hypothetical protein
VFDIIKFSEKLNLDEVSSYKSIGMIRSITGILLFIVFACTHPPSEDDHFIENLMKQNPGQFASIVAHADSFEVQIIYTQINRDQDNQPQFRSFYYNVDTNRYFYPASTVKLPAVLLSMEKLKKLNIPSLDIYSTMLSDSVYAGQVSVKQDSTAENGFPSVAHYARKILVVSDNDAFNRLYEFIGQNDFNDKLHEKGYNVRILHRLNRFLPPDQNRHTEAVRFLQNDSTIYSQPMLVNMDSIRPPEMILKGKGYRMENDSVIYQPFDFTYKNFYSLTDQQDILKSVIFPMSVTPSANFDISEDDRQFIRKYMSQLPTETPYPPYYKDTTYYDANCKFLLFGNDHNPIPDNIRIFNKVGNAYGFLIDNAYIVDFDNNIVFMLSAVINCNTNGIYNDGEYDYDGLGYPFMKNIGELIYQYELKRKRVNKPDLSEFRISYDLPRSNSH